jgi:hypothetical protein
LKFEKYPQNRRFSCDQFAVAIGGLVMIKQPAGDGGGQYRPHDVAVNRSITHEAGDAVGVFAGFRERRSSSESPPGFLPGDQGAYKAVLNVVLADEQLLDGQEP